MYAIAPSTTKVYVGGDFTTVKNAAASPSSSITNLFAYDKATGKLDAAWRPQVDGQVNALPPRPTAGTSTSPVASRP